MTTATMEPDVELERSIEVLERRIEDKLAEVLGWECKEKEATSLLASLKARYIEAASEAVQGRKSPTDTLSQQIGDLTEKLVGITRVIAIRREELSELKAALQPLQVQKTQLVRGRLVEEERVGVTELIARMEAALSDLHSLALTFGNGVHELRTKQYLDDGNKRAALNAASALERKGAGLRA
jgi:hypothetical protein